MKKGLTLVLGTLLSFAAQAQSVDLTVNPVSGTGVVIPVLQWTSVNVTGCTASGGWSGSKATSGQQQQPSIVTTTTYTITCTSTVAASGKADLVWTPPVTQTDGTALTNLAGYKVYWGSSPTTLTNSVTLNNPGLAAYTVQPLAAGTWYFAVTAFGSTGIESVFSNVAQKTISSGSTTVTDSATVAVTPAPNPPTGLTVTDGVAFETRVRKGELVVWREAGTIATGTECNPDQRIGNTDYYAVPRDEVNRIRRSLSNVVVAICREPVTVG